MSLFLVLAAPLWYLIVVSLYREPSRGLMGIALPWLTGILIGIAGLSVTLSFLTRTPFGMRITELYPWAWIRGSGWPLLLGGLVVSSICLFRPSPYSRIRETAGRLSGIASVYLVWTALVLDPGFEASGLFFIPVLWMASLGAAVFLLDRGFRTDGPLGYVMAAGGIGISSLITFAAGLHAVGGRLAAWIIAGALCLAGLAGVYLDSRGRFD